MCVPGLSFFFFFASDKQGPKTSRVSERLATGTDWPNARGGTCQKSCEKRKRATAGRCRWSRATEGGGRVRRKERKAGDRRAAACRRLPPHSTYPPVSNHMMHAAKGHGLVGVMFLDEYVRVLSLSLFSAGGGVRARESLAGAASFGRQGSTVAIASVGAAGAGACALADSPASRTAGALVPACPARARARALSDSDQPPRARGARRPARGRGWLDAMRM